MKFNIKVIGYDIYDNSCRKYLSKTLHELLFLNSYSSNNNNLDEIKIIKKFPMKAIIIYYTPTTDDYIDYSQIDSIKFNISDKLNLLNHIN
jgi:hypothetical protein